jgi:hypothetical protein
VIHLQLFACCKTCAGGSNFDVVVGYTSVFVTAAAGALHFTLCTLLVFYPVYTLPSVLVYLRV